MLAADKLQLQSALKQQAVALKEKEFNLHHSNLMTVGTQAAVLAGLDITMLIEFNPPEDSLWGPHPNHLILARFLKMIYYGVIISAFGCNMIVVAHTTTLSVLGAGLALRGPDGSMMTATDALYEERRHVFRIFGYGLALTVGSLLLSVWILLHWEAAAVCFVVVLAVMKQMKNNYTRVANTFYYDERDTVDFRDIFEGPAAITAVPIHAARNLYSNMQQSIGGIQQSSVNDYSQVEGSNRNIPNGGTIFSDEKATKSSFSSWWSGGTKAVNRSSFADGVNDEERGIEEPKEQQMLVQRSPSPSVLNASSSTTTVIQMNDRMKQRRPPTYSHSSSFGK
jgi:hypothetical protein